MAVKSVGKSKQSRQIQKICSLENKEAPNIYPNVSPQESYQRSISLISSTSPNFKRRSHYPSSRKLFNENQEVEEKNVKPPLKTSATVCTSILTEKCNFATTESKMSRDSVNSLCKTSDSLCSLDLNPFKSVLGLRNYHSESYDANEINQGGAVSLFNIKEKKQFKIKSPIRDSISQFEKICTLTFEEALYRFKNLKHEVIRGKLWKVGLFEKFGRCWTKNKLEDENLEMAERIIKFSLTGFASSSNFHLSLMKTIRGIFVKKYKRIAKDDFYELISDCEYPLVAMLNLLFLERFFEPQVNALMNLSGLQQGSALRVIFSLSDIAVTNLRRSRLNPYINQCNKCLEVFCFFYAGLVVHWNNKFLIYGMNEKTKKNCLKKCRKYAKANTYSLIKTAECLYE